MAVQEPTDGELLRAYATGDENAFARLYDRHDRACFGFIRRLVGSADEAIAEDLHQDTWVAVSRSAESFDDRKARFVTWLFTIARNKVMDHFRAQKVSSVWESVDADLDCVADQSAGPMERVMTKQLAEAFVKAVEGLPLTQRETFLLFTEGEMTIEEVGAATGVGQETAKSRLRYARDTLRKLLSGWGVAHA